MSDNTNGLKFNTHTLIIFPYFMLAKNSHLKNDIVALHWSTWSVHLDVYSTSNLYTECHQHHRGGVRRFIGVGVCVCVCGGGGGGHGVYSL